MLRLAILFEESILDFLSVSAGLAVWSLDGKNKSAKEVAYGQRMGPMTVTEGEVPVVVRRPDLIVDHKVIGRVRI